MPKSEAPPTPSLLLTRTQHICLVPKFLKHPRDMSTRKETAGDRDSRGQRWGCLVPPCEPGHLGALAHRSPYFPQRLPSLLQDT